MQLRPDEYRVERKRGGGYAIYFSLYRIGNAWTLWGAKRLIRKHKRGLGPGSIAYRESA